MASSQRDARCEEISQASTAHSEAVVADGRQTDTVPVKVESSEREQADDPPDGGYGWVCCIATFWINAHTWGVNSVSTIAPYRGFDCWLNPETGLWRLPRTLSQ